MAALEELIVAVNANTAEVQRLVAATEKLIGLRTEAIETVRAAAETPAKETPAKETKASKAAAAKAEKAAEEAPKAEEAAAEKPDAAEAPKAEVETVDLDVMRGIIDGSVEATDDLMRAVAATYVGWGGTEDSPVSKEDRTARLKKVKAILDNPKVAAKTMAETKPNVRKAVVKKIVEFIDELAPATAEDDDLDAI